MSLFIWYAILELSKRKNFDDDVHWSEIFQRKYQARKKRESKSRNLFLEEWRFSVHCVPLPTILFFLGGGGRGEIFHKKAYNE